MSEINTASSAVQVSLAYYRAWTGRDFDQAMTYIADDIVCDAPAGRVVGAEGSATSWSRSARSSLGTS